MLPIRSLFIDKLFFITPPRSLRRVTPYPSPSLSIMGTMEELHDNYGKFYAQLLEFVGDFTNRLLPDAPRELQFVPVVADILPEDDPDFSTGDPDGVVQRALIIKQMTQLVLARARQFVQEGSYEWYDNHAGMLNIWLSLVSLSLATFQLADQENTEYLDTGIGAICTGFKSYRAIDVDKLRALQDVLIASA
ncbi:hypothetical protein EGW08_015684 [Elysia chlorotica]|uniref:Uncharacterized protein n=1 Tax=Elysia chlorotica TaxID=188477 RepID=A0A433T4W3_ELYCH|nr:hypothetical protein EGW08_015684 [Elysia chlorotica]